jgi:hypothetical protein
LDRPPCVAKARHQLTRDDSGAVFSIAFSVWKAVPGPATGQNVKLASVDRDRHRETQLDRNEKGERRPDAPPDEKGGHG